MNNFVDIKGKSLVWENKEIRFRGTNIGNWLNIENFMIGIPFAEHKMREVFAEELGAPLARKFFDAYVDNYVTDADFKFMAQLGLNLVRVPFNYRHFENDMAPGVYSRLGFRYLDRVVQLAGKFHIHLLLDFHAAPGSQSEDWHSDNATIESRFFEVKDFQDRAVALWKAVAERYRDKRWVLGYDLLNEPNTKHHDRLNAYYGKALKAIRSVDKNHIVVVEGSRWSDDIFSLDLSLFKDKRVMPSFHHYPFFGIRKYPGMHNGKRCDHQGLLDSMKDKFAFYDRVRRPMLLGECGFTARKPFNGPYEILRDLLTVMEEKGIHWTLWSFKDVGPMGLLVPKPTTPWMKFVGHDEVKNALQQRSKLWAALRKTHDRAYPTMSEVVRTKAIKQMTGGVEHLELYRFAGRLKKCSPSAIAAMPTSFRFDNCAPNPKGIRVIEQFLRGR